MAEHLVHVVDDDAAMRESIVFLLETDGIASRPYDSAIALLDRGDALEPGCILTDVRMPAMSGLELIEALKQRGIARPVIVLTGHADVALAVQAMKAGVVDFLEKPFQDHALLRAVRTALSQSEIVSVHSEIAERAALLTAREKEVFEAVAAGESNKSAALKLGISPRTVEIYRANVMTKMQADTLSDLVRMALMLERP
ncbi:MAG: response regulator [Alphaproteobacteria bacterium]|nr:response regulator [Alphaproteobacteria bacterium]